MNRPSALAYLFAAWLGAACAGAVPPLDPALAALPDPGEMPAEPDPESPPAEPGSEEATAEPGAPGARTPPTTVVINPGGADREPTLIEASEAAKLHRRHAPPPVAVITNENLSEYANRGKLTFREPDEPEAAVADEPVAQEAEADPAAAAAPGGAEAPAEGSETYWRQGVRRLREQWREAVDEAALLAERSEVLRRDFYSEDDPYVRDGRIKPAWDRTLDRLETALQAADDRRAELAAFIDDGRRRGALPGWLRDGVELEPQPPREERDLPEHESQEPTIVGEGGKRP